jgi:beta-lactam-binding protein with PASTA domain
VRKKAGTGQPPGTVVEMRPNAGTVVASGSTVRLVIAK